MPSLSRDKVIPALIRACPSFKERWNRHAAGMHFDASLLYVNLGEFTEHLVHLKSESREDEIAASFNSAERIYKRGEAYVREAIVVGLIEGIRQAGGDPKAFEPYVGERLKKAWAAHSIDGDVEPMDEDEFWRIIAVQQDLPTKSERKRALAARLRELEPVGIVRFDHRFNELRDRAYRWDLWGAAFILNGGCGDDGFDYFRCWLMAQGRDVFEPTLDDPESLAEFQFRRSTQEASFETLAYVADNVFRGKTRLGMPDRVIQSPRKPAGEAWTEGDLPNLFPRLCARFGEP